MSEGKKKLPLSIAISALIKDDKILLIKREKGDYVGLLGLPGGKIEKDEHISKAATREIYEESKIKSEFKKYLGIVSEHLIENGEITNHFLLHLCELEPKTTEVVNGREGELNWFSLDKIKSMKDKIIPSDFLMIEKMIVKGSKYNLPACRQGREPTNYYDCVLEKIGDNYVLNKFE